VLLKKESVMRMLFAAAFAVATTFGAQAKPGWDGLDLQVPFEVMGAPTQSAVQQTCMRADLTGNADALPYLAQQVFCGKTYKPTMPHGSETSGEAQ
jgi:hypothetical protein